MLPLSLLLFAFGLALLLLAARRREAAGLPGGRVVYADTSAWGRVEKPLYDRVLDLTGRPDYLVRQGKTIIPVEVKSGRAPEAPYDSHIYQLAAYCLLVEKTYRRRPPYGLIHYPNRTFAVDYTEALESSLLDVLAEMRSLDGESRVGRSHEERARCNHCGYQNDCEERL
jgi:CRISPR-associated exonuclease Cas4